MIKNEAEEFSAFIEEIVKEAEEKEEQLTYAHYDMMLLAIRNINNQIADYFAEADKEKALIDKWVLEKNSKLQNKIEWLEKKLEAFIRDKGLKTIELSNGTLKFHKKQDKVEIVDFELFLKNAKPELLTIIPESAKPNLSKIKEQISYKKIPGVELIKGKEEFSYKIIERKEEEDGRQKEIGTPIKPTMLNRVAV
ncbi:MAG TPA: host-nuclease inhibitor Gam family protein [Ignavibacteriaceae bacterium]|nr:host-nuclease inhibitor Gam family protein [Ignavibacteriaceae bacterium]